MACGRMGNTLSAQPTLRAPQFIPQMAVSRTFCTRRWSTEEQRSQAWTSICGAARKCSSLAPTQTEQNSYSPSLNALGNVLHCRGIGPLNSTCASQQKRQNQTTVQFNEKTNRPPGHCQALDANWSMNAPTLPHPGVRSESWTVRNASSSLPAVELVPANPESLIIDDLYHRRPHQQACAPCFASRT